MNKSQKPKRLCLSVDSVLYGDDDDSLKSESYFRQVREVSETMADNKSMKKLNVEDEEPV